MKFLLDGIYVSLAHLHFILDLLLINLKLFFQAISVEDFVADPETFRFKHLNLLSEVNTLLLFTLELLLKRFVDHCHKII